jgi:hypothetical protein
MLAELPKLPPGAFDTVFCFGVFYHTIHHLPLLRAIARLAPRVLLMDTAVSRGDLPVILLREDTAADEGNAIGEEGEADERPLVGYPTRSALDLLLRKAGLEYTCVDWNEVAVPSWDGLVDYRDGGRVTLRAAPVARPTVPSSADPA